MEIREGDRAAALQETTHLHNFVVQSYRKLLILDCVSNRVRKQSSCTTSLYRTTHSVCGTAHFVCRNYYQPHNFVVRKITLDCEAIECVSNQAAQLRCTELQ